MKSLMVALVNLTVRDRSAIGGSIGEGHRRRVVTVPAVLTFALLMVFTVQALYPAIWMVASSLKSTGELFATSWQLPSTWVFSNYADAWRVASLGTTMWNSALVTMGGLTILLAVTVPAAYALARLSLPWGGGIFLLFLVPLMVPLEATGIPLFLIIKNIGLLDSPVALMLVYAVGTMPVAFIILRAFFIGIPKEIEEAAVIDGASKLQIIYHIVLPLARPGIATVVIFQGMWMWNEYFLALLLIRSPELNTVPLGLVQFFGRFETSWTLLFAALTIVTLPVVLLYLLMQKQFIEGLTTGATKG